jgi:hypothetical protein
MAAGFLRTQLALGGFLAGVTLASQFQPGAALSAWWVLGLLPVFCLGKLRHPLFWLILALGVGTSYTQLWRSWYFASFALGESLTLTAKLVSPPDQRSNKSLLTLQPWPPQGRGTILVPGQRHHPSTHHLPSTFYLWRYFKHKWRARSAPTL